MPEGVHFLEVDRGWVNLGHVAVVRYIAKEALEFLSASGKVLATLTHYPEDAANILSPIIPAAAGATAAVMTLCSPGLGARPDEIFSELQPIAGWRLSWGVASPLLVEVPANSQRVLIVMPDGRIKEPDASTYASVEDAESAVLAQAQADWDRRQLSRPRATA